MAKKRKRYVPRGSSGALSMTAKVAPKQDPYRYIRDGKKQQVAGRANLPTTRQKDLASYVLPSQDSITAIRKGEAGAMDIADVALSLPGLAAVKPLVKGAKNMGVLKKVAEKGAELLGESSEKLKKPKPKPPTAPRTNVKTREVTSGSARPPTGAAKQAMLKKVEKGVEKIKDTANQRKIAKDIKAKRGGDGKPPAVVGKPPKSKVPAKRKPTTPAKPTDQRGFNLGSTKSKNKRNLLGPLVGGTLAAGTAAYLTQSEKDAKPAAGSQATKNKAPYVEGYNMDMDDFDSPKPTKPTKPTKQADDGYRYYGKKGTGLGDFSRKFGFKYATPEQFEKDFGMDDGEKRGGRPGKSKMKTQGLNRSKRTGFSGRGTGAALRGF